MGEPRKGRHSRGYLPHIDADGLTQFVTIRLADAVPLPLIRQWKERLSLGDQAQSPDPEAALELQRWIARYEDRGHGACFLRKPNVAAAVQQILLNTVPGLLHWVIMPNHLHVLFRNDGEALGTTMRKLKGRTARKANQLLGRTGSFWFPDYFDRMIRDHDHLRRTVFYIEQNPVKAGLARTAEEWEFGSAFCAPSHMEGAD